MPLKVLQPGRGGNMRAVSTVLAVRRTTWPLPTLLILWTVAAILAPTNIDAAESRDYAYLMLQGKLVDSPKERPVAGVTIRLISGSRIFEATTDQRGLFIFEKLPVTPVDRKLCNIPPIQYNRLETVNSSATNG